MNKSVIGLAVLALLHQSQAFAATSSGFTISANSSSAQSLSSGTGTVNSGAALSVGGSSVAVTVTGNATITNNGSIAQTGTGRAIDLNTANVTLTINNNAGATISSTGNDTIRVNKPTDVVTLNNYGTITSTNPSLGGNQAVNFNVATTTGGNTINNYSTGVISAYGADAVRPGTNGYVYNNGTIQSTAVNGSSSDGIDAQKNSGVTIVNGSALAGDTTGTGLIDGGRHGITGGNADSATTDGTFVMQITNNQGATIRGNNGSGVNIDGFNAKEVVTIVNHGTITGNGVSSDGDGVDVDGIVNLTNTGTIQSLHAYNDTSEGVTVGGGTINNSGTIVGLNSATNADGTANTGTGRGITIAGVDKVVVNGVESAVPVQAPYAATTITNSGLIRGDSDAGIAFTSQLASGFSHVINNLVGGIIQGGGSVASAILTAADAVTINNAGTIDGSSSGKAITGGAGNLTVNITGGQAQVYGDLTGGASANNTLTITPGTGNSFSYAGNVSNFGTANVGSGTVNYAGTWNNTGTITNSGNFNNTGVITGAGTYIQAAGTTQNAGSFSQATLNVTGGTFAQVAGGSTTISGSTSNAGTLIINGSNAFKTGSFANTGNLVVNAGAQLVTGSFSQTAGSTVLNNGTIDPPTTVSVTGGTFGGTGTVDGSMRVSSATVLVGQGTLNVTGSYTQTSGVLSFGAGGSSFLEVAGGYNITGTTLLFSFTGSVPSIFSIYDFIGGNGTLSNDEFLYAINGGPATSLTFDASTGSFTVSAVPEPETYALLLAGLGLMGGVVQRRKSRKA